MNSKNKGALLLKAILRHENCFLLSVATDSKDGNQWIDTWKNWANFSPVFQVLMLCSQKSRKHHDG